MLKNINVDETTPYSKYILIVYIQRASFSAEKGIILNKVIMGTSGRVNYRISTFIN